MAIIYADQVSELAIEATYAGRPVVNVLHYYNDEGAINDADKAKDIVDAWQDHVMGRLNTNYDLQAARWRSLDRDDTNQGLVAIDVTKRMQGADASAGAPPNVALLVKKVTNNRQRGQRDGRMFLAGIPEANVGDGGDLVAAYRTATQTAMDAFLDAVNDDAFGVGGGSGLVVLNTTPESREKGNLEVDLTFRTVSALVVDPRVASQRDRLR